MWGKVRPVGSRVPKPGHKPQVEPPYIWGSFYQAEFTSSGTDALAIAVAVALNRKKVQSRPEVILPAYGCPDIVSAVVSQGVKPVLVDLMPDTPFMDLEKVREAIGPSTIAIIAVGFLGIPERLELLASVCREHDLFLIEDSAQCFPPASVNSGVADAVILSFGRGKPINLMGGGALLIRSEAIATCSAVLDHFPLLRTEIGLKWRLKRLIFNALMRRIPYLLLERLPFLRLGETRYRPLDGASRNDIPARLVLSGIRSFENRPVQHPIYDSCLDTLDTKGWIRLGLTNKKLGGLDERLPRLRYAILAPSTELRDRAELELNAHGISANSFYRNSLPDVPGVEALLIQKKEYPVADSFASRLLTLPCHEDVREADIKLIAAVLDGLSTREPPQACAHHR
ncbi:DegT/DnrJ/EryC1/StrS family aminotransferase [Marinobacter zhejiangensis]|uniref:dTDP-4-amino-4,6-dideoxygalactose transaminase n=1 Tax=Marinobacter zhejiangensis TaxID=488535 RepID=A0A1I4RNG1_9GAMM|nr:DegT/DnrJ/EryC1/StrS family aminotransferase [Marinobacter zhejiangensis]SFM53777.1 dTDP-4-amino-4,6-dideoxygalactose transaminase [Marinobacter zhejiangensis]